MSVNQSPMKMFTAGFNCAQIVASYCAEELGRDIDEARGAMGGFGGGLNCGEVCGTVSGAVYNISNSIRHCEYEDFETSQHLVKTVNEFTDRFRAEFGALRCAELAPESDMSKCHLYIKRAKEIALELIERETGK